MSVPVAAKTSNGQNFIGSATASLSNGTFLLTAANCLHCYGIYNQWDLSIHVAFKTTDGRYGTALISRNATGMSGIGIGTANDGTTFDFSMGNPIPKDDEAHIPFRTASGTCDGRLPTAARIAALLLCAAITSTSAIMRDSASCQPRRIQLTCVSL